MLLEMLDAKLESKEQDMIKIRRYLHAHPEVSYQERETSKYIAQFYQDKDVEITTNVGGYGIKVVIDTKRAGKNIAIRADFDALAIPDETGTEYASIYPGLSHACGHDAHTAYLMKLAETLIEMRDNLTGKITIIHQPAEELPPGGAQFMIEDGVLEGVDEIYGIHVMSTMDFGNIFYHHGNTMQARAKFEITLKGNGGHGASPHEANDSIVAASHLVVALQTIVSRRLNPFESGVVTIGEFRGTGQFNVIKDSVTLVGDVRSMSSKTGQLLQQQITQIVHGIGQTFGCDVIFDYKNDYPVLFNNHELTDSVVTILNKYKIGEVKDSGLLSPSEDFAYYSQIIPACFFFVGAKPNGPFYPHHHPKFNIDERSLLISAKAMGRVVLRAMNLI